MAVGDRGKAPNTTGTQPRKRVDAPADKRGRKSVKCGAGRGAKHPKHAAHRATPSAQSRSYKRCIKRRPALRRRAGRVECLQRAKRLHKGSKGKISRSYRRCIKRRGVWRH